MNLRRHLLTLLALLPALALAVPFAPGNDNDIVQGREYTVLQVPVPTTSGDRLEVREFFFYGCSHCFHFEPELEAWLKRKPADVEFIHTPALLNPSWELLGRAYYAAEELGVLAKVHAPLFSAIHLKNQRIDSKEKVASFFAAAGVTPAQFDAAWASMKVDTRVKNAGALARKYMIQGTPTLTVAGKYVVQPGAKALPTVDYLLNLERKAKQRK